MSKTHIFQAVCDTPIARITGCVCRYKVCRLATPLGTTEKLVPGSAG